MFGIETYIERRVRLASQLPSGLLLFLGNLDSPINYPANAYPFRQDSTFLYYFGVNQPGYAAIIDLDGSRTVVFADEASIDDIVWTGPQPRVSALAERVGVRETAPTAALADHLGRALAEGRTVHFLPPYRHANAIRLSRLLGIAPEEQPSLASVDLLRAVIEMRAVKSTEEIREIERAVDLTIEMHRVAMQMAQPGMTEAQIGARVAEVALAAGRELAFPLIATVHGETLHNTLRGHMLESGQLFLLDAGAESPEHYAADLTTTFPVGPHFTARQREVYQIVMDAHRAALAASRPGVPFRDVHLLACRHLAEGLEALGLMKGNLDEAVARGAHALFFPCGLGHMLGLDVHDMEDLGEVWVGYEGEPKSMQFGLKSLRLARPLQPGFVFTIEPGLYFIPELMDRWRAERRFEEFIDYRRLDAYRDFGGVRLEVDVVVESDACRVLGWERPHTVEDIESIRSAG